MSFVSKYELRETDSFVTMGFHKINQYHVRSLEVERGGRFFSIENGTFEPPKISMN